MLSDEVIEKVIERLLVRIEEGNTYVLKKIGESIKKIGTLSPSKAQELVQVLKYGGDYNKIVKKLAEITELNTKDIKKIFEEVAKSDYQFAEQFYEYRNKKYIPWNENVSLKKQVEALAEITAKEYVNISRTRSLGFGFQNDKTGKVTFKGLQKAYSDIIDEAILNVSQGKETFDEVLYRNLKNISESGLKVIYPTTYIGKDGIERHYTRRLDSALRMNIKAGIRDMHNKMQQQLGEEFGSDGVEITVHSNSAPDHINAQGRQFSNDEYKKLQKDGVAKDYTNKEIDLHLILKNNTPAKGFRPISEYNCYHYIFSIVLGVSKPAYSDEELDKLKEKNNKGFTYDGKKYSMYEGTQLQRRIETEIRKAKDDQIMAKASGNEKLLFESQDRINKLIKKYQELSDVSGLPTKVERIKVNNYKKVDIEINDIPDNKKPIITNVSKEKEFNFNEFKERLLKEKDIRVDDSINTLDSRLVKRNLEQLDYLSDKYNITDRQYLDFNAGTAKRNYIGTTYYSHNQISLNPEYFNKRETLIEAETRSQKYGWHNKIKDENLDLYTITHEYGHAVENNYVRKYLSDHKGINTNERRNGYLMKEENLRKEIDKDIRDSLFNEIKQKEKINITEIKNKYFSGYSKSRTHYEWFAETFAQMILGEENELTKALERWLERNY